MKSIQAELHDQPNVDKYGPLRVYQSNAGYYVGSTFNDGDFPEPGTRDTSYFRTAEDAEIALRCIERVYAEWQLDEHYENDIARTATVVQARATAAMFAALPEYGSDICMRIFP